MISSNHSITVASFPTSTPSLTFEIPVFLKVEREKTTGDAWFNMKAPELTQELKRDLKVLQMRGSLDPKRFYKKNDRDGLPKYFQVRKQSLRTLK